MPGRRVHNKIAKMFGIDEELADKVNELTDLAWVLNPKKHRQMLGHDIKTSPIMFYLLFRNPKAGLANAIHIMVDNYAKDKKTKKLLEILSKI